MLSVTRTVCCDAAATRTQGETAGDGPPQLVQAVRANRFLGDKTVVSAQDARVWDIRRRAFSGAAALVRVDLSTRSVDAEAFRECAKLTRAPIGARTERVGNFAFYGCSALTDLSLLHANRRLSVGRAAFSMCTRLTQIELNVQTLPPSVFAGCCCLDYAILPALERAGSAAFYGCPLRGRFEAPRLARVGASCFRDTQMLAVTFAGAVVLETSALGGSSVRSVRFLPGVVGESAVTLGSRALFGTHLAALCLPSRARLASRSCAHNTRLERLELQEGIKVVAHACFQGSTGLRQVSVPASATIVGDRAFARATRLTTVVLLGQHTCVSDSAFEQCNALRAVYAPAGSSVRAVNGVAVTPLTAAAVMRRSHTIALLIYRRVVAEADRRAVFAMLLCERRIDGGAAAALPAAPHDVWLHVVAWVVATNLLTC